MKTFFHSDGTLFAINNAGQYRLAVGDYIFDSSDGSIIRYSAGGGLSGFWSTIGNGFKKIGKFIGQNFGTIATAGITIYGLNQQGSLAQQQAQAAADAQARAAANAQPVPAAGGGLGDLTGYMPIILIALVAYMVLSKREK